VNQDEVIQLAIKKVKALESQAEGIVKGNRSDQSIVSFAGYSTELIEFINRNIPSDEIRRYLKELPLVNYQPKNGKFWQYIISPSWWIILYKEYETKNKIIDEIREAKQKYLNLELLLKGLTG
jgi:hypothetical protein